MGVITKQYAFASKTGVCRIHAESWAPDNIEIKGVVQIHHGMAEHIQRYIGFAEYMCSRGYAVIAHDMANHGGSNDKAEDTGYFGEKDGWLKLIADMEEVTKIAEKEFPGKPLFVFGHSMGSFITRCYIAQHKGKLGGAVICGTSGKNPLAGVSLLLSSVIGGVKGKKYKSKLLDNAAFGAFNKTFSGRTEKDWLTRDEKIVDKYIDDDKCGFVFSTQGFNDLGHLVLASNSKKWYESVSKTLPICLISGENDPVGNYGKGVEEVYSKLKATGHRVYRKLYAGARHEILNETNKEDVYCDVANFFDNVIDGKLDA